MLRLFPEKQPAPALHLLPEKQPHLTLHLFLAERLYLAQQLLPVLQMLPAFFQVPQMETKMASAVDLKTPEKQAWEKEAQ